MADLPILFSAPMVRSLIAGTKTQTRRTFGKLRRFGPIHQFDISDTPGYAWHFRDASGRFHDLRGGELLKYLPYKVGDRLYVREHWKADRSHDDVAPRDLEPGLRPLWYSAGYLMDTGNQKFWSDKSGADYDASVTRGKHRQGMHMPKWASRITLIVEGVKVERLNDCSDEDATAEGIERFGNGWRDYQDDGCNMMHAVGSYMTLWENINGLGSWNANPWVVAYTFRRIMGNIDMIEAAA
ncbi:hypothetical protein CFBP5507_06295 [Agrobacterium salinitolerans]|uniref:Uncharacterized protein n=1 Tax=Agrobacterium salinitolerans TaxID=1183413 RepID=A0A4Z1QY51_9HYPH|nr:hypothetical protein [Agrobacterium salinitolerans]UYZ08610.1 hypothetical protein CFBP5507_06295 [Agrobacterium salinitolerans]